MIDTGVIELYKLSTYTIKIAWDKKKCIKLHILSIPSKSYLRNPSIIILYDIYLMNYKELPSTMKVVLKQKNFRSISIILEDENNTLHNDLLLFNLYLEHLISVCNVWLCVFKNNSCVVYRSSSNIGNTTPYSIKIESHTINSLVFAALFEVTYVVTHQLEVGHRLTKEFFFCQIFIT